MKQSRHDKLARRLLDQVSVQLGTVSVRQSKRGGKRVFVVDVEPGAALREQPDTIEGTPIVYASRKVQTIRD